jgi:hypothetical protein
MRGLGQSGALLKAMADVCVKEIEMRATSIWEDLHRALVMTGVRPNTELSTELRRVFNEGGDGELIAAIRSGDGANCGALCRASGRCARSPRS